VVPEEHGRLCGCLFLDATLLELPLVLTGYFGYNASNEKIIETHGDRHKAVGIKSA